MARDPITSAFFAAMRTNFVVTRQLERVEKALAGLTLAALTPRRMSDLTARLYAARGSYHAHGLFPWEQDWFAADLPSPPARLLIGGAGSGREVVALLAMGYEVVAFDPAASYVAHAHAQVQHPGLLAFHCGAYEDLLTAEHGLADLIDGHGPYDAIILGWGSFTHMPVAAERADLLRYLAKRCPAGPVLLSFWLRHARASERQTRAFALGWRLGSALTGRPPGDQPIEGDQVMARCGYGHRFTPAEIATLAASTDYVLSRAPGPEQAYAHATFKPSPRPSPSAP
jgi:hypothetical protein